MDVLPKQLVLLDADGRPTNPRRSWSRVDPRSVDARRFAEADWDRILCDHVDVLADALREADVIAADSTLKLLGVQIDNIDVLLAEVKNDAAGEHDLRRLVLLEDKLLRNPEARRAVLAQLLEYAQTVQEGWSINPEVIAAKLPSHRAWVEANVDTLQYTLRRADILLIIAGDGVDPGLQKLARRFTAQDNPLNLMELALVSMALFTLDGQLLLVPHVVSSVERGQREVTIRVKVEDTQGKAVPARIERDLEAEQQQVSRGAGRHVDRERFLAACTPPAGSLFSYLLDDAVRRGHTIYWGTTGFSTGAQVAGGGDRWAFAYGFPPDDFQFYFQDGAPWSSGKESAAFRKELMSTGIFREAGRLTLKSRVDETTSVRAHEVARRILDRVDESIRDVSKA